MIKLNDNERIDKVNDGITIIQRTDGLTYGTDALLLASYINSKNKKCIEFGTGTGIISLLMLQREKARRIYGIENQEDFATITQKNASINSFDTQLTVINKDVRNVKQSDIDGEADIIFTNPPYMKKDAGISSATDKKNIARREIYGEIFDFCQAAKKLLKFGGKFYCVYRPDRLAELIYSLKSNTLEPKRMTFIHPHTDSAPSLVLVEARLGGGEELNITRPLIIYTDPSHTKYTDDMTYIYENGIFPSKRY